MTKLQLLPIAIVAVVVSVLAGRSFSAPDKYAVSVPGGLAFSEFKGYEDWSVVAISDNQGKIAAILGNPAMIQAYRDGVPGNGKPFPDGARMAKIHWTPKKQDALPGTADSPRRPARRGLHGQGRQAVRRQRRMGMGRVRL